ncbi:MAG: tyrosine-type recombinase/integrase, partial [Bacteroidales bacterium]
MRYNVKYSIEKRKDKNGLLIEVKVPIFADIHFASTRIFYFTGYRIDKINFDETTGKAKLNTSAYEGKRKISASDVNRRIKLIDAALTNIFENTKVPPTKPDLVIELDNACKKNETISVEAEPIAEVINFEQMFKDYIKNARLSEGRKKHAISTLNHWNRFAKAKKLTLTFDTVTPDLLRSFEKYLLNEKVTIKIKDKKVTKAARGLNTLHTIFAITRTFWNHARKEYKNKGIDLQYPFESYKVPAETYGTPIYLTLEERNKLFDATLESERLSKVRDIFVFQCLTGARVGDLCRLTKSNISNNMLSYIPRKTKEGKPVTVTVPLSPKAKELISRYDMPDGRLMPFITDQRYNEYLKELFEKV